MPTVETALVVFRSRSVRPGSSLPSAPSVDQPTGEESFGALLWKARFHILVHSEAPFSAPAAADQRSFDPSASCPASSFSLSIPSVSCGGRRAAKGGLRRSLVVKDSEAERSRGIDSDLLSSIVQDPYARPGCAAACSVAAQLEPELRHPPPIGEHQNPPEHANDVGE